MAAVLLAAAALARAEDEPSKSAIPGLPEGTTLDLEFSAGWGFFGFGNSLYANSHDEVEQDLSDNWMEGYVKGGFSMTHKLSGGSELYGALTGVGERTYNAPPPIVGGEASSFDVEDLYVGWRSGSSSDLGENAFDVVVGRTQYKLGHGMLIYDGASEGGSRGGFWSGARKSYEMAGIARVKVGQHHHRGLLPRPRRAARERLGQQDLRRQFRVLVERGQRARRHLFNVVGGRLARIPRRHGPHRPARLSSRPSNR